MWMAIHLIGIFNLNCGDIPQPKQVFQGYLSLAVSKPVALNKAKFTVVGESTWRLDKKDVPIEIQLLINNVNESSMLFRTFDTFELVLTDQKGETMRAGGARDLTILTKPILIPSKAAFAITREAVIKWNDDSKEHRLLFYDGTGHVAWYGPLRPGQYKLSFLYYMSPNPLNRKALPTPQKIDPPNWFGTVRTEEIRIEITK